MFRRALLALPLLALVACGGARAPEPVSYHGSLRGYTDNDPHDWTRSPYGLEVHGTDASRHNGPIDWRAAAANGMSFVWIKATEGGDRLDPAFHRNWEGAAQAGIPRGAYHVFYFCRSAAEQAEWFIRNVPRTPGAMPPVLDVEWTPLSPTCTIRPPKEQLWPELRTFLRMLEQHYGTRPVIYTVPDLFDERDMNQFGGYEYWLRSTAAHPSERYPGTPWTFWQYTSTAVGPGFQSELDLNAFNGNAAGFAQWFARRQVP
ncbi:glycoside hydrolase family 25 protein [Pelagovum pacificum]|uniref:Glycoside hydrolase family 25 protein n=2 Tax=Pelagovum pacificum TaxID=2588711 RepID=A0A5C5GCH2_9RHOB|nr:glycoside hydrolase family 25 protein [Pelagovum pacificum]TNY31680.1 glycoside hydrolase family 25 protein [Pelagovum pacificum]